MSDEPQANGRVTIAPQVLITIVRQTTLDNEGVQALSAKPPRRKRVKGKRAAAPGVEVVLAGNGVHAAVQIIAHPTANMMSLAETLQTDISRAIEHMIELDVVDVNVIVEDVFVADAPAEEAAA